MAATTSPATVVVTLALWLLLVGFPSLRLGGSGGAGATSVPACNGNVHNDNNDDDKNGTNICGENATLGRAIVAALNLSFPGLEAVAQAAKSNDLNAACDELAQYYRNSNTSAWLRLANTVPPSSRRVGGRTDQMVDTDYFYLNGVATGAVIPRNGDGGLDWLDHGPRDDQEFMNCLNRHDSFIQLLQAYNATGNPVYTRYFNALVVDWVTHLPCPNALANADRSSPCTPLGVEKPTGPTCSWVVESTKQQQRCKTGTMESPWRSLEMGIRMMRQWPASFFGFQQAPNEDFSVSARVLMVLAVAEHLEALQVDGGHPGHGTPNWEMTQW